MKVINPEKKKEAKVFIFRPNPQEITTPSDLREELFLQFGDKIVPDTDDFPIGYFRGQIKLWIRTNSDVADIWDLLSKGSGSLWLHGVKESHMHEDDSSKQPSRRRREDHKGSAASPAMSEDDHQQRIDSIKRKLHEKHTWQYVHTNAIPRVG